jgi:hypothetical protein
MAYFIFLKYLNSLEDFRKNPHVKIPSKSPCTNFQSLPKIQISNKFEKFYYLNWAHLRFSAQPPGPWPPGQLGPARPSPSLTREPHPFVFHLRPLGHDAAVTGSPSNPIKGCLGIRSSPAPPSPLSMPRASPCRALLHRRLHHRRVVAPPPSEPQ